MKQTTPGMVGGVRMRAARRGQGYRKEGLTGCPLGDDDGEDAGPDGDQGHCNEEGRGNGSHDVGPHSAAVHDALEDGQAALEEGAVVVAQHDLEMALHETDHHQDACTWQKCAMQ